MIHSDSKAVTDLKAWEEIVLNYLEYTGQQVNSGNEI